MRGNEIGRREQSFLSIPLKSQIFIPLGIERGNEIRFNDYLLKLPKYSYIFNNLF